MKVLVVLNGIAQRRKIFYRSILPALQEVATIEVRETRHHGHAEILARQACQESFDVVFAAGGDGTLHQVLNGLLMNESLYMPTVGLIPLGSGNDFARTVRIVANGKKLAQLLKQNTPRETDVGRMTLLNDANNTIQRYFMNECSLGMGPEVVRRIQQEGSSWGPSFTYFKSIVKTFLSLAREPIQVKWPDKEFKGRACVFAMANGTAFGHSVYIAPDARLDDGELNTFLAGDFPVWRFLLYLQRIKAGNKVNDSKIAYGTTKRVEVNSEKKLAVEADGELVGFTPLITEVVPRRIKFLY